MSDSHRAGLSAAATSPDDVTAIRPENAAWALAEIGRLRHAADVAHDALHRLTVGRMDRLDEVIRLEAEIGRLTAERDYLRNAWTRVIINDRRTSVSEYTLVTYERASAEAEALVAAALAEFKKASEPEGGDS